MNVDELYFTEGFIVGVVFSLFVVFAVGNFAGKIIEKRYTEKDMAKFHDAINNKIAYMLTVLNASRTMVLFAKNGSYFKNGWGLNSFVAYNEKVSAMAKTKQGNPIPRFKDKKKTIRAEDFEEALGVLLQQKMLTLEVNNNYEGLAVSKSALQKRHAQSGCYFIFTAKHRVARHFKLYTEEKIVAILCVEWQSTNVPIDAKAIYEYYRKEINEIEALIKGKHDVLIKSFEAEN